MAIAEYLGTGLPDGVSLGRTNDKISFYGVTPVVRPVASVTVGTDIATVILELANIRSKLVALGLLTA